MEVIRLKERYGLNGGTLAPYIIDCPTGNEKEWKRPAVIVVPGGAYEHVSKREGAPVACNFLARGFQAFVLEYSTVKDGARYPEQLNELAAAVDCLKSNCAEYNVNRDEIFVVGFSAGGHLVANLAVDYFNLNFDCKPRAVGLGYPVISAFSGHTRSFDNLLDGYSESEKKVLLKRLSLDGAVTKKTVPAFIWATATDSAVPALNSLKFACALAKKGIKYELHVYPEAEHGGSTCDFEVNGENSAYKKNAQWLDNCASFFRLFTAEKY